MNNFFNKYFRIGAVKFQPPHRPAGPVVTISREYGCSGSSIAVKLTNAINKRLGEKKWRVITNEVLQTAAQDLRVDPQSISHIFGADTKNMISDLIASFAVKQYTSDRKIKETISKVVFSFADLGQCVIVGRASCVVAQDALKSLHIRLIAPMEWRVKVIQQRLALPYHQAEELVENTDKRRRKFRSYFSEKKKDSSIYDVVFNCARLSDDQIVDSLMHLLECKAFFE